MSGQPAETELELIAKAQQGDRQAFGELVRRHREGTINVVYRMCGDVNLAEDAAAWLLPASQQKLSLSEIFSLPGASLGDVGQIMLQLLSDGGPLGWAVTLNLVSLVVIGLLYWSWLASWWALRQHRQPRV